MRKHKRHALKLVIDNTDDAAQRLGQHALQRGKRLADYYGFELDPADLPPADAFQVTVWLQQQQDKAFKKRFEAIKTKPNENSDPDTFLDWMRGTGQDFPDPDDLEAWDGDAIENLRTFAKIIERKAEADAKQKRNELDKQNTAEVMQDLADRAAAAPVQKFKHKSTTISDARYREVCAAFEAAPPGTKATEIAKQLGVSSATTSHARHRRALEALEAGEPLPHWCASQSRKKFASSLLAEYAKKRTKKDSDK